MGKGFVCLRAALRSAALCGLVLGLSAGSASAQGTTTDYTGDGYADFAVVTGSAGGSYTYWVSDYMFGVMSARTWGMTGDHTIGGDFDGDGKIDVAVWRPAAGGAAGYWVYRSSDSQPAFIGFGTTGDNARVIGDYDYDLKTDAAVFRTGPGAADPAYWYHRRSSDGVIVGEQWGAGQMVFAAPGDYDGDFKNDLAVQAFSGSDAIFYIKQSTAGVAAYFFGTTNDLVVPGDYDGDGKTDIAIARSTGGIVQWWVRRSSDGTLFSQNWGITGDRVAHGDYDGDGKTDVAIWRPSTRQFWVSKSTGGVAMRYWGVTEFDFNVARANSF
jgi:spore coat protein A, manganese oxidase